MVITDDFLRKLTKGNRPLVIVNGKYYYANPDDKDFVIGGVVLDREDGLHAVIDFIYKDKAALRDGLVVQMAVPLSRLVKLVEANANNCN